MTKSQELANEVAAEVSRAQSLFAPINGPHEGYGVIKEEFDEFWDEVKKYNLNKNHDTRPQMRAELIQLAAMCLRTIHDVIDVSEKPKIVIEPKKGFVVYDETWERDLWYSEEEKCLWQANISPEHPTTIFATKKDAQKAITQTKKFEKGHHTWSKNKYVIRAVSSGICV